MTSPARLNLANLITLSRLFLVPVAVGLIIERRYGAAFWVFVTAGLSDALDGYIAKHLDCRTRLGALLDPLADKSLLVSLYVTLGVFGALPIWLVILVVFRDAMIVGGFVLIQAIAASQEFRPLYISKINTLVQTTVIGFVLARQGLAIDPGTVTSLLILGAATTTAASGLSYLVHWARILARSEQAL
jgi:cardiolipin synthase (CMP-forming)